MTWGGGETAKSWNVGEMASMVYNWESNEVDAVVVTDGSRSRYKVYEGVTLMIHYKQWPRLLQVAIPIKSRI